MNVVFDETGLVVRGWSDRRVIMDLLPLVCYNRVHEYWGATGWRFEGILWGGVSDSDGDSDGVGDSDSDGEW